MFICTLLSGPMYWLMIPFICRTINRYPSFHIMLDHKYKVFYHLALHPNTTKVAEELYLSQPAISKSIRELERELGISLFHREKGRMQLTGAGHYLFHEVEQFFKKEREILFEVNKMRDSFNGTLAIGASTTLSQYVLPEVLAQFTTLYPDIKIKVTSGNTDQIEEEIRQGSLHLAFIEGRPNQPDIHYIPYLRDEIVLVCSTRHTVPESMSLEELSKQCFVFREKGSGTYEVIKKQLSDAGISIHRLQTHLILGTTEGIKQYLQYSDCFALLSIYSIHNELATGKLKVVETEGLKIERTFYAIHCQGEVDPYAQKFLDFLKL